MPAESRENPLMKTGNFNAFFREKYLTKNNKYLSDADPKNAFDMEKHLRRRPAVVKPDEVFDYYEIDAADLPEDTEP